MLQTRHSPPQQEGRWLLQGELCIPCGDWGELTLGEKTPALSSLSFHGSLTSHSAKYFSWERDKQVSASYFEGQGGCQSNLCHPKQNILMCLENKKPQLERKPHRANCSPCSEMMLLYETGDFIRKTQIYIKKKTKSITEVSSHCQTFSSANNITLTPVKMTRQYTGEKITFVVPCMGGVVIWSTLAPVWEPHRFQKAVQPPENVVKQ